MRLINAITLFKNVTKQLGSTTMYLPIDFQELIWEEPTVLAIPIDWINEKINDKSRAPLYRRYVEMLLSEWLKDKEEGKN